MNNHIHNIHGFELYIQRSGDVGEIDKLFDSREYGCYWFSRLVGCLLDNVLALEKLVRHQLTVVVLEKSYHVHHGVIDWVCCPVADIQEIRFLDHVNGLLHESLLYSHDFLKHTHFLGVSDPHVGICVGGCAVRDDDRTKVIWVEKRSGWY